MSISDEEGSFSFFNLEPGTYTVYASSTESIEKAVCTNVVVKENETAVMEDMFLTATGSISGYVIVDGNETGNMGFLVSLGGTSFVSVTDDAGYYCLTGIPAGEAYQLVISKGNFTSRGVVSCTVPAHGMYNAGVTNYSSEELDSEAGVLIWKGSLAVAPEKPKTNWAYFCTEDGCSYIYNGADWTLLAAKGEKGDQGIQGVQGEVGETGESGSNGISITWKGESAIAPAGPELYWAYFNTADGCSYIYDGNKWTLLASKGAKGDQGIQGVQGETGAQGEQGIQGETGASGTDGISIIWLGSFEEDPEDASEMNAYYNSTDGCSYIYDGKKWTLLASKGAKGDQGIQGVQGETGAQGEQGIQGETGASGTDGISIIWKGRHASASELVNPEKLWAYFNTSDYNSYIFNGENWELLVSRGDPDADEHTYSEEWSSDSFYHWHSATCLHPELRSDQAEHVWDEGVVTKEATHVINGVMTYTCTVCGKTKTEIIPAGHAYEAVVTKPTTTEQGYTTYTCIRCDDYFVSDYVDPVVVPAPTFTSQPSSLNIAPNGQGISLTIETDTEEPYTAEYQWYSSTDGTTATGTIIDAETGSTLSLGAFTVKGIYYYYCVVKNVFTDDDGDSWDSPETVSDVVSVAYTGLPTVYVNTPDAVAITSKQIWVENASLSINGSEWNVSDVTTSVKGRGNTTWTMPKKPYALKLNKKQAILGMEKHKRWVLIANYSDKSLLRYSFASYLSNEIFVKMSWAPSFEFVDLVLNGEVQGNYIVGEQIKIDKNRVNISKERNGFIVEVNERLDEDYNFRTSHGLAVSLKDFDDEKNEAGEFGNTFVKPIIQNAEDVLFSEEYKNAETGYSSVIDVDSFIDWYLVNEIAKNNDSIDFSSVYMYYNPDDGLLYRGPIWDFDIAFGNINYNGCDDYSGLWVSNGLWISRLMTDPAFKSKVKERFFQTKDDVYQAINTWIQDKADAIKTSAEVNFNIWNTLGTYTWPNSDGYEERTTYQSEVDYLIEWVRNRMDWLSAEIATW